MNHQHETQMMAEDDGRLQARHAFANPVVLSDAFHPMIIYGTALLAVCHLLGIILGDLLGHALGMQTNVGGVGIAMLLLIIARVYLHRSGRLCATSESGVHYWGAIYIPVVVAMAMQQNVVAALRGGPVALIAAAGSVVLCGLAVSFINRMEPDTENQTEDE